MDQSGFTCKWRSQLIYNGTSQYLGGFVMCKRGVLYIHPDTAATTRWESLLTLSLLSVSDIVNAVKNILHYPAWAELNVAAKIPHHNVV